MTKPSVFIIESLTFEDENNKRFEGKFLSHLLKLGGIETQYFYIRTKKEFKEVLSKFYDSKYRYLHISCHGDKKSLAFTLDDISHEEFGVLTEAFLYKKRLFLSACSATNRHLAEKVIPKSNCYSIIGPSNDIGFDDAAIIWATFYHLIFKANNRAMKRTDILPTLKKLVKTFDVEMNYFSVSTSRKSGVKGTIIRNKNAV